MASAAAAMEQLYFPPAGQGLRPQSQQPPRDVGLEPAVVNELEGFCQAHPDGRKVRAPRWALWRHGHLVHVSGDFDEPVQVASLRKTWHAMMVGAAILQGRIPSYHQKLNHWQSELAGNHAEATWWHVLTQSAGFDYPHGDHPAYKPGEMWTYSDWNLFHLCHALAKVYGRRDFYDHYEEAARAAYFDAIGLTGWGTAIVFDQGSQMDDGVRFLFSLEHMGRLGLLAVARGSWEGQELVPSWFVGELETKQTCGMKVNYDGPYDGKIELDPAQFPEAPYGYLTWVNTAGDYFPGAGRAWAWAAGAGGTRTLWNHRLGIVWAGIGLDTPPSALGVPQIIEAHLR